jgi:hypothetical protein
MGIHTVLFFFAAATSTRIISGKYKWLNREERRCREPREAASIKGEHWTDEAGMGKLFC